MWRSTCLVLSLLPWAALSMESPVSAQTCAPPPSGMVAWWPGDGDARDIVGARDGLPFGSVTYGPGKVSEAFTALAADGWIEVPDDPAWTFGSEDFTIDLWALVAQDLGRNPFIAHDDAGGSFRKWIFWYDTGALRLHLNSPEAGGHDVLAHPWQPAMGQWYHLAVTRKGMTYTLYIDGVAVASVDDSYLIPDPSAPLTIARAEDFYLRGQVDEVEIFDRALAATEIQAIFDAGSAGKCRDLYLPSPTDFYTLTPCRLLDTREPTGTFGGPALVAGADRVFPLFEQCGIPTNARAVSVNLTVTGSTTQGNLRLFPAGTPLPLVSSINYAAGQTRANNALASLNRLGEIAVRCSQAEGTAHFILDVNGYFR
jgi:hypothetical protein